ncbi:anacyclamide/piricyclamide family prenylated cyclic peptide [Roseofilum casamattae]|uniref:Anacyclamide/piricyclamide family prenylated cyclic peptide n=1 Tax=Roseofilum casamattae BLCC-M143 TaxID=3022442 RepID=A0ABT7C2G1_9CYAN|nr:anacyclamide/piricyclamide family prenylated cyclic peptide [Roseofilum casamattae]MDJ1185611.1 anacyclamide/piricyclamide family prenylated cyclic peptide [Roseofilum casamattae BLCC-M143]
MKKITKDLKPAIVAPVKRENVATVSRDGNAIGALYTERPSIEGDLYYFNPFAGDDAE